MHKPMRFTFYSLLILCCAACGEEVSEEGTLTLNFKATYAGDPLVLLAETYTYPDGTPLKLQLLNYFVSDIELLKSTTSNAENHTLSEIELVAHDNAFDTETAQEGVNLSYNDVPAGEYIGIRFGLGVAPRLNQTQPGDYDPGHPLSENYWSPATDYIFAKIEGVADLNQDGDFNTGLTYHTGKDELYTTLTFERPLNIPVDGAQMLNFELDLRQVLESAEAEYLDISDPSLTIDHSVKPAVYEFLWANYLRAIRLKQ